MARKGAPQEEPEEQSAVALRLTKAATRLFADKGFDRTSVQEIVEAAGVTKGALYHYFDSKDDLLYGIYGRVLAEQRDRLEKFLVDEGPIPDRLRGAAADVVVTTIENLDDNTIFFRSLHQLSEDKQKAVRRERRRYHERFRKLIEDGQAAGLFRDDVPAELAMDYFFGAIHHLGQWYRRNGALSPTQVGAHFAELFLASLQP